MSTDLNLALIILIKDFLIIYQAAHKLPYHNLIIMVTYYIAQYCITNWSMAKHLRTQNTTAQGSKINSVLIKNINLSKSESTTKL